MYQFSGKLKIASIALMLIGALGIALSFYNAPKTVEQATEMLSHKADDSHGGGHGRLRGRAAWAVHVCHVEASAPDV